MAYHLFRTKDQLIVEFSEAPGLFRQLAPGFDLNRLFTSAAPESVIREAYESVSDAVSFDRESGSQPPIGDQEVWAAGVTYYRSRTARMEEAEVAGGDIFYDKVYDAERPELFFKATAPRTRGHLDAVAIRKDSSWDVPEPELTLAINSFGKIFGYTIGNDMSSRSIEGENPLYLPQAKVYTGSCSIGPCLVIGPSPSPDTTIEIQIQRDGTTVFSGDTQVSQLKRGLEELAEFLFRSNEFRYGAYLMTGTGIVPDSDFTLQSGDQVIISIEGVGRLSNQVEVV